MFNPVVLNKRKGKEKRRRIDDRTDREVKAKRRRNKGN